MEKELVCANCGSTNMQNMIWMNVSYAICKECGTMHMVKYMKEKKKDLGPPSLPPRHPKDNPQG